jgi:formylglycine-generating enzyme required for sulfatase activity
MSVRVCLVALVVLAIAGSSQALKREDLSAAAQALVPPGKEGVAVKLKDGRVYMGELVEERDGKMVLRVTRGGISARRIIALGDIVDRKEGDVAPQLAIALAKLELNPDHSLSQKEYRAAILLFLEFLEKCGEANEAADIKTRCEAYMRELLLVRKGLEKVAGEWLTPVKAALRKFERLGEEMATLKKDRAFRKSEELQATYQTMQDERRAAARELPKLTKDRTETLLAQKDFIGAAEEINAFLHFWMDHVVGRGSKRDSDAENYGIKEMDFGYVLGLQKTIVNAYLKHVGKPKQPANVKVPPEMVYVPGGFLLMGDEQATAESHEFPMHIVYVTPFLIDKYEVSNAEYRKFVEFVERTREVWMEHKDAPPLKKHQAEGWEDKSLSGDDQPVVGVDWFDAYAYAQWAKKRLPTEAEWELAARGTDSRKFPWGNDIKNVTVNYPNGRKALAAEMDRQNPPRPPEQTGCSCFKKDLPPPPPTTLPEETWPVTAHVPAKAQKAIANDFLLWDKTFLSPYGLAHMGGNVAEWVHDWYDQDYYGKSPLIDPQGPDEGKTHVYRGGHYLSKTADELLAFRRGGAPARDKYGRRRRVHKRKKVAPTVGIRCVRAIEGADAGESIEDALSKASFEDLFAELKSVLAQ